MKGRWLGLLPFLVAVAALVVFVRVVSSHDAPGDWLAWRYLAIIGKGLAFAAAALSGGDWLGGRLGLRRGPFRERLVLGFALGVAAWALAIVLVGLVGGLGPVAFVALPVAMLAAGGRRVVVDLARFARLVSRVRRSPPQLVAAPLRAAGVIGVLAVWLPLLTPRTVSYDAWWYHLPLAEQYAAAGAIFRLASAAART